MAVNERLILQFCCPNQQRVANVDYVMDSEMCISNCLLKSLSEYVQSCGPIDTGQYF